jgi:hypothetical protein
MAEEECPKHNVPLKLRRNVKTGDLALAFPFCDAEQPPEKRETTGVGRKTNKTSNRLARKCGYISACPRGPTKMLDWGSANAR